MIENFSTTHSNFNMLEKLPLALAYFRVIQDASEMPIDCEFLYANRNFEEISGFKSSDLIGKKTSKTDISIFSSDYNWVLFYCIMAMSGEKVQFEEYSDSTHRWYQIAGFCPEPSTFSLSFTDITHTKYSESMLKATHNLSMLLNSKTRLDEILKCSLDFALKITGMECGGIYLVDENSGNLVLQNSSGFKANFIQTVREYEKDSSNHQLISRGSPVYFSTEVLRSIPHLAEEGILSLGAIPILHEHKLIACINVASRQANALNHKSKFMLEAISRLTANAISRAKNENILLQNEEKFKTIFHQNKIPFILYEPETGLIEETNKSAADFYGYAVQALTEMTVYELLEMNRDNMDREVAAILKQQLTYTKTVAVKADKTRIPVELCSSPVFLSGKTFVFSIIRIPARNAS